MPINEKRYLQILPTWNRDDFLSRKWIQDWESGLSDQNIIRPIVIRIKNFFLYKVLNSSGHESVILGKENSMFRTEVEASLSRHLQPANREAWQKVFKEVNENLESSGSLLVFVPSASSSTIYPENLPGNLSRGEYGGAIQELIGLAASYKNILPIDTVKILREAKRHHRTHYAMDYHWNARGSLYVLLVFLQRLKREKFD